ncbi:phosphate ABC transporter permease PstA [Pelosinus sp. IPA-1]|uniref:phosphate ABC transporter permease PstA n=1 Tax=Pelosinus sp. IPA-1 TaxID=3029569 RepID=UPI0024361A66|nr:phosphate ABC transporter permease PstA [Pelosinus sp. IPA-1]GMB01012.1 phosphate transport system permease protein PstA [Pelosinus sp. IPA-1]
MMSRIVRRKITDGVARFLLGVAVIVAIVPLFSILLYIVKQGAAGLSFAFFTHLPAPVGAVGGGMANAIIGTLLLILISSGISIPIGLAAGTYLSEFGHGKLGSIIRFITDVLSGVPSIVTGLLVYSLVVLAMGRFSAIAGGIALAIIMIPTLTRTTEQMIKLVPQSLREASLALGATQSQTLFRIVLPTAARGITTGVMLAVARVMGESAPLLFTAFGSSFWSFRLDQPIAALPLQIYAYAISPYQSWHEQAWAGALTLLGIIFVITILARFLTRTQHYS